MSKEGDENMFVTDIVLPPKRKLKKPVIKKSKFSNLTPQEWKESNESSKNNSGMTGLGYKDIFGGK